MKHALKDIPQDTPPLPTGVVATRIDPETGAKARASQKNAMREFYDYNKAFINMSRTHDGAFVVTPGRNRHEKGYYMSPRVQPTAAMAIALKADNPTLRIQGGEK